MKRIDPTQPDTLCGYPPDTVFLALTKSEVEQLRRLVGTATIIASQFAFVNEVMALLDEPVRKS